MNICTVIVASEERKQRWIYFSSIFQYLIKDTLANFKEIKSIIESTKSHMRIRSWNSDL